MGSEEVKLFGFWVSPYSKRVEIAFKIKGVEYEYVEEKELLSNKSVELLKYNPIHKKIPVLLHHRKPIAESLMILEYIDETWKTNPLLPSDPYDRAQARFWAKSIDDKFMPTIRSALMTTSQDEEVQKAIEEAEGFLKILENQIKGNKFFGGNEIGYLDIAAIVVAQWLPALQETFGKEVLTKEKFPGICAWADRLLASSVIKESLPNKDKMVEFFRVRFANLLPNNNAQN